MRFGIVGLGVALIAVGILFPSGGGLAADRMAVVGLQTEPTATREAPPQLTLTPTEIPTFTPTPLPGPTATPAPASPADAATATPTPQSTPALLPQSGGMELPLGGLLVLMGMGTLGVGVLGRGRYDRPKR